MKKLILIGLTFFSLISTSLWAQPSPDLFKEGVMAYDSYTMSELEDFTNRKGEKSIRFQTRGKVFNCSNIFEKSLIVNVKECSQSQLNLEIITNRRAIFSGDPQKGYRNSLFCLDDKWEFVEREVEVKLPKKCTFSVESGGKVLINGRDLDPNLEINKIKKACRSYFNSDDHYSAVCINITAGCRLRGESPESKSCTGRYNIDVETELERIE